MGGGSWMNVIGVAGVTSVVVCQETFVIPNRFGNLLDGVCPTVVQQKNSLFLVAEFGTMFQAAGLLYAGLTVVMNAARGEVRAHAGPEGGDAGDCV